MDGEGAAGAPQAKNAIVDQLAAERYRHVLTEQTALGTSAQSAFTMYQGIATATLGAVSIVVLSVGDWNIPDNAARAVIRTAALIIALTGAAFLGTMVGGMFSWFDLRREEQLLSQRYAPGLERNEPSWRNFWRWKEFYLALLVLVWTIAGIWLLMGPYLRLVEQNS